MRWFVALGDSLSEGRGDPGPDGSLVGWARRLQQRLADDGSPTQLAVLASRSAEVGDVLGGQLSHLEPGPLALVSVTLGVNDATGQYRARDFAAGVDRLLTVVCGRCDTVLITTPPDITQVVSLDRDLSALLRRRLQDARARISAAARRHSAVCLDLWTLPALRREDGWSPDRLHPGPWGHQAIADAFFDLLADRRDLTAT